MNMFATGYQEISRKRFLSVNSRVRSGCIQYKSEELRIGVTLKALKDSIMSGRVKMPQAKHAHHLLGRIVSYSSCLKMVPGKVSVSFPLLPPLLHIIKGEL